ncbi:MAG: CHAD domain-containing protein [Tepidisphaeraceae bacterium]|jgi:CHAD domain-containing protein
MEEKKNEFPLLDHLDGVVEVLRQTAPRAVRQSDEEAVHDARVASRRMKAALDLFAPVISARRAKDFSRINRSLRKRLGALRDLDVMLSHLSRMKSPRRADAAQWISQRLRDLREEEIAKTAHDLHPPRVLARIGTWWGVREEIIAVQEAAGSLLGESVHMQLDAFADQADRLVQGAPGNDPHQLRIAGKSLRYTLEMAKAHGIAIPKSVLAGFKRLQNSLGLWHDYVVLTERILSESVAQEVALHDPPRQQALLSLAGATLKKAQLYLGQVFEHWNQEGREIAAQIRQCIPLTKPAELESPPIAETKPPVAHEELTGTGLA